MKVRTTSLRDGDGLGGQARVAVDLALLAGQTPGGPGAVMSLESPRHTNLDEIIRREASLPG
jgi:hypothetical protein